MTVQGGVGVTVVDGVQRTVQGVHQNCLIVVVPRDELGKFAIARGGEAICQGLDVRVKSGKEVFEKMGVQRVIPPVYPTTGGVCPAFCTGHPRNFEGNAVVPAPPGEIPDERIELREATPLFAQVGLAACVVHG